MRLFPFTSQCKRSVEKRRLLPVFLLLAHQSGPAFVGSENENAGRSLRQARVSGFRFFRVRAEMEASCEPVRGREEGYSEVPICTTVNVWPATVIVPVRFNPLGFGATV